MKREALNRLINDTFERLTRLRRTKGVEYSGNEDALSNFKRGAADTGCTAEQVLWIYVAKHLDSIKTYIRDGAIFAKGPHVSYSTRSELSEPIEGRIDDVINYMLLLQGLIHESKQATGQPRVDDGRAGGTTGRAYTEAEFQELADKGARKPEADVREHDVAGQVRSAAEEGSGSQYVAPGALGAGTLRRATDVAESSGTRRYFGDGKGAALGGELQPERGVGRNGDETRSTGD